MSESRQFSLITHWSLANFDLWEDNVRTGLLFEAHSLQTAKKISTVGQKTAYYPKNRIFARVQLLITPYSFCE
jgi:hypothetical protein